MCVFPPRHVAKGCENLWTDTGDKSRNEAKRERKTNKKRHKKWLELQTKQFSVSELYKTQHNDYKMHKTWEKMT